MSYINQKVRECIADILIGEYSSENAQRLKMAVVKAGIVSPLEQDLLGEETRQHLQVMNEHLDEVDKPEGFDQVKEHLTAYIMSTQRDDGSRSAQSGRSETSSPC
jgi:hypothetical protein